MTRPWQTVARVETAEGALELRQRGAADFLITIAGRVLMTSQARRSEEALATLALRDARRRASTVCSSAGSGWATRCAPRSMCCRDARVTVVELNAESPPGAAVRWPPLTGGAVERSARDDRRGRRRPTTSRARRRRLRRDPARPVRRPARGHPTADDPLYGPTALARARAALATGGVFAVWSEEADARFERRLADAGFRVEKQHSGPWRTRAYSYLGYTLR